MRPDANAPEHDSEEFIEYLRMNNQVLYEDFEWLVIKNAKYGWPTAFGKDMCPIISRGLLEKYGHLEWRKKPVEKQTVKRFHFHIHDASDH